MAKRRDRREWTWVEIQLLREFYPNTPSTVIGQAVGRPGDAVNQKARHLGLRKDEEYLCSATSPHRHWTADELLVLSDWYAVSLTADLAEYLGRNEQHVHAKAHKLGLRKEIETIADIARERATTTRCGEIYGFKKGHVPANKGLRRPGWSPGNMRLTQFKKGNHPQTWKPIGSTRVNPDGYLDRKVSDTGYPPRDWVGVHRLVWMAVHGEIPAGHRVCFKPGRRTTVESEITLDAIELLTGRELMARNTIHNLSRELKSVVLLRGVLNRQINKRSTKA